LIFNIQEYRRFKSCIYKVSKSLWCGTCSLHVFTSTHNFINKKQLLGKDRSDVHELTLNDIVIPDLFNGGWEGFACLCIDTIGFLVFNVGLLHFEEGVLSVKT